MRSEAQVRTAESSRPRLTFAAVNGWRGPGALAIAVAHFGVVTDFIVARQLTPIALLVDLFFVLSGLMIAQAYSDKLTSPAHLPEYAVRRLGRIWPVQAATLSILVGYELLKFFAQRFSGASFTSPAFDGGGGRAVSAIASNLLLVQSLGLHDHETWNFPSWSLSVEFATYVAFGAFCLASPRLRRWLAVATIVLSMSILVLVAPHGMRSTYDFGIFRCLAGFFAGTLCYEVANHWGPPRWRYPTLIEVVSMGLVVGWIVSSGNGVTAFAAPLVFAIFVYVFLGEGGQLSRLLRLPFLQKLAELSFSIYMVHALVLMFGIAALHAISHRFDLGLVRPLAQAQASTPAVVVETIHLESVPARLALLTVYLVCVIGATMLAHRLVEVPGRKLFVRFAQVMGRLAPSFIPGRTLATNPGVEPAP